MATREQKRKRKGEGRGKKKMVWEEVDNDYRVGTIRGGKETRTHTHILESVLGKDGREEKRRKVAERMGRIRREENRMARQNERASMGVSRSRDDYRLGKPILHARYLPPPPPLLYGRSALSIISFLSPFFLSPPSFSSTRHSLSISLP